MFTWQFINLFFQCHSSVFIHVIFMTLVQCVVFISGGVKHLSSDQQYNVVTTTVWTLWTEKTLKGDYLVYSIAIYRTSVFILNKYWRFVILLDEGRKYEENGQKTWKIVLKHKILYFKIKIWKEWKHFWKQERKKFLKLLISFWHDRQNDVNKFEHFWVFTHH